MIEIGARIVVFPGATITLEDGVYVGKNSTLVAHSDLSIGARTLIGENVSLHTEDHGPVGHRDQYSTTPIHIAEDCWIGAGVVVLRGSTIGAGTTVGANAVVRGELPGGVLAVGVPAAVKAQIR
jgi:acetyltransferase-like isoleucine patch superfamily enzyme